MSWNVFIYHILYIKIFINLHRIPWIWSWHRKWRTPSSMEFHGTTGIIEVRKLQVISNSNNAISGDFLIIRLKIALWVHYWGLTSATFSFGLVIIRVPRSIHIHATSNVSFFMTREVPLNSMEWSGYHTRSKLYLDPHNFKWPIFNYRLGPNDSHGITWIWSCHRNCRAQGPWNSMEPLV